MHKDPKRKYFIFNAAEVKKVIDKYIVSQYPDINYDIKESLSTRSIYITFNLNDNSKTVRLSDHPGKNLKYHYISKRTRVSKIVSIFNNSIKVLYMDKRDAMWDNLF